MQNLEAYWMTQMRWSEVFKCSTGKFPPLLCAPVPSRTAGDPQRGLPDLWWKYNGSPLTVFINCRCRKWCFLLSPKWLQTHHVISKTAPISTWWSELHTECGESWLLGPAWCCFERLSVCNMILGYPGLWVPVFCDGADFPSWWPQASEMRFKIICPSLVQRKTWLCVWWG